MNLNEPGLESAFLKYIGHDPSVQKQHQRFYVQFFESCERVVDLGCGLGDFVELLVAQGIDAVGVDSDPLAVQTMRKDGIPIVHADAIAYLQTSSPESVDGIYAGHFVEHLPPDKVLDLVRLSYQALKPGGIIVLTTPDPRSLYAQQEMFYQHFGHVRLYHPRLLCFFLEHVGFGRHDDTVGFGLRECPIRFHRLDAAIDFTAESPNLDAVLIYLGDAFREIGNGDLGA